MSSSDWKYSVASGATGTAISVAMDMTEGIVARFRTMAIARVSVLTGHVAGSMVQQMVAIAITVGVALLIGFDPTATAVEWLAATGFLAVVAFAVVGPLGLDEARASGGGRDDPPPAAARRMSLRSQAHPPALPGRRSRTSLRFGEGAEGRFGGFSSGSSIGGQTG